MILYAIVAVDHLLTNVNLVQYLHIFNTEELVFKLAQVITSQMEEFATNAQILAKIVLIIELEDVLVVI